jgi:hypothetical protein
MLKKFKQTKGGYVVITTVIFFLIISMAVISAVVIPTTNQIKSIRDASKTRQSYLAADNVNEEGLYRLKLGKTLPSTLSLPFSNNVTSTANVSTVGSQTRIYTAGESGDTSRYAETYFSSTGPATGFIYSAQIGTGGLSMGGGASIIGDVYSNGSITGDTSNLTITGSATVANTAPAVVNQTNSYTNGTSPVNINMGTTTARQDVAQSFSVDSTVQLTSIRLYVKKTLAGAPANATIRIVPDSGGSPSNSGTVGTGTLLAASVTTSYTYVSIPIASAPSLTPGNTYWVVIDTPSVSTTKYFTLAATANTYSLGTAKYGKWSSSGGQNVWSAIIPASSDLYFDISLGGIPNTISGNGQWNRLSIGGFAWANQVNNSSVTGTAYCQTATYLYNSSNGTKTCDTSRSDPAMLSYPITDQNITDWKSVATAGGINNGNYSLGGGQNASLGPKKIVGNLSVSGGSTLSITGTVWVTGYIDLSGGSIIKLATAGGTSDGMIIADGRIILTGGSSMRGSGTSGSYMVAMTTSQCPDAGNCSGPESGNAIDVQGGSGSMVMFAPYGKMALAGGVVVNSAVAKTISLNGGSSINYDNGLSIIDFITTGIGTGTTNTGSWKVDSWNEVSQ